MPVENTPSKLGTLGSQYHISFLWVDLPVQVLVGKDICFAFVFFFSSKGLAFQYETFPTFESA